MIVNNFDTKLGQYVDQNNQPLGKDPSIFVQKPADSQETPQPSTMKDLTSVKAAQSTTPTYIPKSFADQFYFKSDGTFWVYINGTWTNIGGATGNMIQAIGTTLPSASTYSGQFYYLTTTDILYRSNGTAWIGIN